MTTPSGAARSTRDSISAAGSSRTDPRTRRSRDALIAAAGALLAELDPDDISITDIAQRAGLSRPTVYQHFADKESALAAVIQVRIDGILHGEQQLPPGPPTQDEAIGRINALVSEISKNHDLYHRVINSNVGTRARTEISGYLFGLVIDYIQRVHPHGGDQEELAHFVTGGAIALLEHWAREADIDSEKERRRISERIWILMQHAVTAPTCPATGK